MAGAIRFLPQSIHPPFSILPAVNYSNSVYDLYQQIPQLNSYQTFKPPNFQTLHYPVQQNTPILLPSSTLNLEPTDLRGNRASKRRDEQSSSQNRQQPQTFSERDGWGNHDGYGNGGPGPGFNGGPGGGGGGVGQSPAISALALLGFLFFLNLIQTSLQNNRQMLTTSTTTTVTTNTSTSNMVSTGGQQVISQTGRVRQRRGFGYEETRLTPVSIPTHPNRQIEVFLHDKDDDDPARIVKEPVRPVWRRTGSYSNVFPVKRIPSSPPNSRTDKLETFSDTKPYHLNTTSSVFQKLKRLSLGCMQLLACNMGRTLMSEMGPNAGFMMRMLGQRFLPQKSPKDWTGRMVRALSFGWRSRGRCSKIYRQCTLTPPTPQRRKLRRNFRERILSRHH